jgi:hypothetical protein
MKSICPTHLNKHNIHQIKQPHLKLLVHHVENKFLFEGILPSQISLLHDLHLHSL